MNFFFNKSRKCDKKRERERKSCWHFECFQISFLLVFFCSIHFHWNCLTISIVNELSRNLYFSFFLFSIRNSTPMNFSHLLDNAHSKWLSIDSFNRILNLIKLEHFFQLINYPWYVALKTLNLLRAFLINKNSMKWIFSWVLWMKLYKV